ncbi:MAG: hypothetical protein E7053_07165 [Lentisphaerae bacterium]|nr:hypothetical protein [Lentisphaerota bacterium]
MKKVMLMLATAVLCGCACVEKPLLRIAVTSDAQAVDIADHWGIVNTEKAFEFLSQFRPDVVVMAGDLADRSGHPGVYRRYWELMQQYFPYGAHQVSCAGNHEFWSGREDDYEEIWHEFTDGLQISRENPCRQTIGGYDFITFTEERRSEYSPEMIAKLKAKLDEAVARDANKPIFLVTHYPPTGTMLGSEGGNGRVALRNLLNGYPQVISLSGHTHRPLECETSIWQGEFTALTTATLSYGCIGGGERFFNVTGGTILPYAREVQQALLIDIFADRVEIHRYNVHDRREINPDELWVVDVPYDPATARLTMARAESAVAPQFAAGSRLKIRHDFGFAYLLFPPAEHDRMVFSYIMRASVKQADGSWLVVKEAEYVADFYRYLVHRTQEVSIKLPENTFQPEKVMRFEVFPVEEFGKRGEPISLEMVVPRTWNLRRSAKQAYPQE